MSLLTNKFFRHYKGGIYYVLNLSTHTETNEILVNYISLNNGELWSRPLAIWSKHVYGNMRYQQITPTVEQIKFLNKLRCTPEWVTNRS